MNEKPKRSQSSQSKQSGCRLFTLLIAFASGICMIGLFVYVQQDLIDSNALITYIEADGEDARARIAEYLGADLPESATDFHWYSQRGFTSDSEIEFNFQLPVSEVRAWIENLGYCLNEPWSDDFRKACGENPRYFISAAPHKTGNWMITIVIYNNY